MKYKPESVELDISIEFCGCEFILDIKYYPGYPAPNCWDHDNPAFSDDGEGPSWELLSGRVSADGKHYRDLTDDELSEVAEKFEGDIDDGAAYAYEHYSPEEEDYD